jgi:hypothetical protein
MDHKLTDEEIDRICSNLRAVDFMKRHQAEINKIPELKEQNDLLSKSVKELMNKLSEEQRDKVLEIHKIQSEAIAEKLQKIKKK